MTITIPEVRTLLGYITDLDPRFTPGDDPARKVASWHRVLDGSAYLPDAMDAVDDYYRGDVFTIMPATIIEWCRSAPPWSSLAHCEGFVHAHAQRPYAESLWRYSGLESPLPELEVAAAAEAGVPVDPSDRRDPAQRQAFTAILDRLYQNSIMARKDELVAAIMELRVPKLVP